MKQCLLLLWVFLAGVSFAVAAEISPAEKWLNAFAWIQTADNLRDAEQWPLALGSYIEAHRHLEKLAAENPDFEPEIVAYRLEKLEISMAEVEKNLVAGDHDIAMEWVDFIETFEKGQGERFANDFTTSFATLEVARTLLEGIVAQNPNGFEAAVATQFEILTESLEWLDSQINQRRASRPSVNFDDGTDWGTTKYIKESDLPGSKDGVEVNSMLFPDGAKPKPEEQPETVDESEKPQGDPKSRKIRLNTKDDSELPEPQ